MAIATLLLCDVIAQQDGNVKFSKGDGFEVRIQGSHSLEDKNKGLKPKKGDTLLVHYVAYPEDGLPFESSKEDDIPFEFTIGQNDVIKCWEEGFKLLEKSQIA